MSKSLLSPQKSNKKLLYKPLSNGIRTQECPLKLALFWVLGAICCALIFVADVFQFPNDMIRVQVEEIFNSRSPKDFLIKTAGCRIPYMDPFDHTVKKFISRPKRPVCNNGIPALVDSNLTSIFIVNSSIANYTDEDGSAPKCCYRPFFRKEPHSDEEDNKIIFEENCTPFEASATISHEFIRVECKFDQNKTYKDFFSFVPNKMDKMPTFERKPMNVLIIGIDAVSRLNFHRQMPTAVEYLKNISAVELLGYNKVGDNTFPNLIPFLTGYNQSEMEKLCWKKKDRFDKCPFIWKDYKAKGFLTSFGEDSSCIGLFNYQRRGFKKQPVDYMWGYFNRKSENEIGNSHNNKTNVVECVGAREVYKVFLSYISNFVEMMTTEDLSYFAFFWGTSLSHDYLNKPRLGDEDYYRLFKYFKEQGYLNNTLMIVMSDHGIRWGDIRQTYQGRMEERLPFIFMVLPDWYKREYQEAYNNLLKNSGRLITPFDLHETLKDFLNPFNLTYNNLMRRYRNNKVRGYSLFYEIPQNRTCVDADIASHWCTCHQSMPVNKNDSIIVEAANFAVGFMNQKLVGYAQCANLTLYNISDARIMTHGDHILNDHSVRDYTIVLETLPGEGIFEVTLRTTVGHNNTYQFEVMGTISRLNLYGQQSVCITDFHLKLYCYCKSLLH